MKEKIKLKLLFIFFLLIFISSCTKTSDDCIKAEKIIDGDTFTTTAGETIRLIGIDTPEKARPYSKAAKEALESFIWLKCLELEKDNSDVDVYDRKLRYVYADNVFVNELLVQNGLAKILIVELDTKYKEQFEKAELYAKSKNLGIWSRRK